MSNIVCKQQILLCVCVIRTLCTHSHRASEEHINGSWFAAREQKAPRKMTGRNFQRKIILHNTHTIHNRHTHRPNKLYYTCIVCGTGHESGVWVCISTVALCATGNYYGII